MRLRPRDFISLFSLPAHNSVQKWKPLQFSLLDSRWSELNLSFPFSSLSCLSIYYLQSLVLTRLLQKLFGLGRNIST